MSSFSKISDTWGVTKILTPELKTLVIPLVQQDFSPVPIRGGFKKTGVASVRHETLYRLIGKDKKQGGNLYRHLRNQGKQYVTRGAKNSGRGCILGRVDIEERPQAGEEKARLGDWEVD